MTPTKQESVSQLRSPLGAELFSKDTEIFSTFEQLSKTLNAVKKEGRGKFTVAIHLLQYSQFSYWLWFRHGINANSWRQISMTKRFPLVV